MNRQLKQIKIEGLRIAACSEKKAAEYVIENRDELKGKYISFVNLYSLVCVLEDEAYKKAQRGAAIRFADGFPVAILQKLHGAHYAKRVTGPDIMERILKETGDAKSGSHFFLGSDDDTLSGLMEKVKEISSSVKVAGTLDPGEVPVGCDGERFYEMIDAIVKKVNEADPDYLWVALGTPKQEFVMEALAGKVDCVMFGVGAAFGFQAQIPPRAPKWMRFMNLEWLYRVFSDPKRLSKRYLKCILALPVIVFHNIFKGRERKATGDKNE